MDERYKKKSNIGALLCFILIIPLMVVIFSSDSISNHSNNIFLIISFYASGVAALYGIWAYARAKGYSGAKGLLLTALGVVGLAILLKLPDKNKSEGK